VGDELGAAAKMWCLWSKHSVFEVGEAVSVKRSDGRYTYVYRYVRMYTDIYVYDTCRYTCM
jgi:hypothetical protein